MSGPAAGLPAPRAPRYLTLDHWRGVACLLVVIFHSTAVWAASGSPAGSGPLDALAFIPLALTRVAWVGVPLFFVISGYAITATADAHRRRGHGLRGYAWRRFRRIYPPYWTMIGLHLVAMLAIDVWLRPGLLSGSPSPIERPWTFTVPEWLGNLTLTESWRHLVPALGGDRDYILGQAWSLCYEEQFYLIVGLVLALAPRRLFGASAIVTLVVILAGLARRSTGVSFEGLFLDGYWIAFAAGILVYREVNHGDRASLIRAVALLAAGIAGGPLLWRGWQAGSIAVGCGFAIVLLALHRHDARTFSSPALVPLRRLGTICYSLYLSHLVVVLAIGSLAWDAGIRDPLPTLLVVLPLSLAAAVVVGAGFWRVVERRFVNRPLPPPGPMAESPGRP